MASSAINPDACLGFARAQNWRQGRSCHEQCPAWPHLCLISRALSTEDAYAAVRRRAAVKRRDHRASWTSQSLQTCCKIGVCHDAWYCGSLLQRSPILSWACWPSLPCQRTRYASVKRRQALGQMRRRQPCSPCETGDWVLFGSSPSWQVSLQSFVVFLTTSQIEV